MKKPVDYKLFFPILGLIIFGMIMISSVSIWSSHRVTSSMVEAGYIESAYNHFYVLRNIIHVAISLTLLGIMVKIPYKYYEKSAKYLFGWTLILLVLVLIIGESYKGATWWIAIPWIPFNIQPTEFLKFSLVVYLAYFFKQNKKYLYTLEGWFFPFLAILGVILVLVGAQPDFWTILVVVPMATMMFFIAGANVKYLLWLTAMGFVFALSIYLIGDYDPETGKNLNSLGYITQRIDGFLADSEDSISNKTINYQTEQALIAIGSWGFTGLWFGASVQKFWYLPEVQGDFIFSVVLEELWFIWSLFLLATYLYIWYRGIYISRHSKDLFAKYSAMGITIWIVLQAFINIGVNLNIVPLTGITLPFISYGGSSLLALSMGCALLLSISRDIELEHKRNQNIFHRHKSTHFIVKLRKRLWL
jgi:cell division protein FtsW